MVEHVRTFKVKIYLDTNKRTKEKVFDLADYLNLDSMLDNIELVLNSIREEGILEGIG